MNLVIISGNAPVSSGNAVNNLKKNFDLMSIIEVHAKDQTWAEATLSVATPSLFSEQRLAILRDYFKVSETELKSLDGPDLTLALVFSKPLPPQSEILKYALSQRAQVITLDESKEESVFPFLNHLMEGNERAFSELDKLTQTYGTQYLLTMIFYSLRRLILPPKNASDFVKKSLAKQSQNFPLEKVKEFYRKTIETDFKIKSGLTDEKLALHLLVEEFMAI